MGGGGIVKIVFPFGKEIENQMHNQWKNQEFGHKKSTEAENFPPLW